MRLDVLEADGLSVEDFDFSEWMKKAGEKVVSTVMPKDGFYGAQEITRTDGTVIKTGKDLLGHTYRNYYQDGTLVKQRCSEGNGRIVTKFFDEQGVVYKTKRTYLAGNGSRTEVQLAKNYHYQEGNFSSQTDSLGRVTEARIDHIQLSDGHPTNTQGIYLSDMLAGDHKGHLIGACLGGPNNEMNVQPMTSYANWVKFKSLENHIIRLADKGSDVSCRIKANFMNSSHRPSSYEAEIIVDGEVLKDPRWTRIENYTEESLKQTHLLGRVREEGRAATIETKPSEMQKLSPFHQIQHRTREFLHQSPELKSGLQAALITLPITSAENVKLFLDGEIDGEQMVVNIAKDTGAASGSAMLITRAGMGVGFLLSKTAEKMGSQMIGEVANSCVPAGIGSFVVQSFGDLSQYMRGAIDGQELFLAMGDHAAAITGSMAGGAAAAAIGSSIGTAVGPAGTLIGGAIGCALASEAYQKAVETGMEAAGPLRDQMVMYKDVVCDTVTQQLPEQASRIKETMGQFIEQTDQKVSGFLDGLRSSHRPEDGQTSEGSSALLNAAMA